MKALLIDDEQKILNVVIHYLETIFPDMEIVATAQNISDGYQKIVTYQPDILFLDINLPDGTAFDLLKKFDQINFKIIFITGHEEYALQAFKFSAIDFILKPVQPDEFKLAVNKACKSIITEEENLKIKTLLENVEDKKTLKRIILRTSEFMHLVEIKDIIRCEADNNYTFFFLQDRTKILVSKTIKEFSKTLEPLGFIRVHQSHLVNVNYIDKYVKSEGGYLLLKDQTDIPISHQNKQMVLKKIEELLYS